MFNFYDEKSCQFECRLQYAANKSGCIPWDYPIPKGFSGLPICTLSSADPNMDGLVIFENAMDSADSLSGCECLPNCEETQYRTQVPI